LVLIGAALMVCVNPTYRAEEVLRRSRVETVTRQLILALQKPDPAHLRGDRNRPAHSAIGAGAAANGMKAIRERRFKADRAAMALAG
jgi:hypothetical protein